MTTISDIKLIRTDTTLDLSQKAEKGCQHEPWPHVAAFSKVSYPARGPYGTPSVKVTSASFFFAHRSFFFFAFQKFTPGKSFVRLTRFPGGP